MELIQLQKTILLVNVFLLDKGTRKKPQEEEEIKKYEDFFTVLNNLPDQLDEEVLKFRGVEADDILAWITQNVSSIAN